LGLVHEVESVVHLKGVFEPLELVGIEIESQKVIGELADLEHYGFSNGKDISNKG